MSELRYWYIDDENGSPEQSTINMLKNSNVQVEKLNLKGITEFGSMKREIIKLSKEPDFGGLIVDLRLDGSGEESTAFNATALAQELRSISSRNETSIYPIVLTSTEEKINNTYVNDKTCHDLFDYKMYKYSEDIDWNKRAKKLISLAEGYKDISQVLSSQFDLQKKISELLRKDLVDIENRLMAEKFEEVFTQVDKHFVIDFVLKQMFHYSNPLINQRVLFAKLGAFSSNIKQGDKDKIFELFKEAKYVGVFSGGWDRWWQQDVEHILLERFGIRFGIITASQRIEILNEKIDVALKPSDKIKYTFSEEFSTICEATKLPLDHLEGFKVNTSHDYLPWQTAKYLSLYAILERINNDKLQPHISEKSRIEEEKQILLGE